MGSPLFVVSNSKVQTWLRCRKRYWFQYVSGAKWPEDVPTPGGIVGTAVHRAMRVLGETKQARIAHRELETYLRMHEDDFVGPGTRHHARALSLFERGCEAFDELERDAVDSWVELGPAVRWTERGLEVRSKIDRADKVADDHYRVVDWKTGYGSNDDETDLQLDIYHVALRDARRLPAEARVTAIAWNLENGERRVRELTRIDAAATLHRLGALSQRIYDTVEWEATPNQLCPYCPWLSQCEAGQAAGFTPYLAEEEDPPYDADDAAGDVMEGIEAVEAEG